MRRYASSCSRARRAINALTALLHLGGVLLAPAIHGLLLWRWARQFGMTSGPALLEMFSPGAIGTSILIITSTIALALCIPRRPGGDVHA